MSQAVVRSGRLLCFLAALGAYFGCSPAATKTAKSAPNAAQSAEPAEPAEGAQPSADEKGRGQRLELPSAVFLSVLPITVRERAQRVAASATSDATFARALRVRLDVMRAYKDMGELTRRTGVRPINGTFQLTDLSRLGSQDPVLPAHSKSSFVLDFDQAAFQAPVSELRKMGSKVTAAQVTAFVGKYIEKKTYARGFDVASRVANTRSGDCSEHAVLTAALLRHFGVASRLVFGIVLVAIKTPDAEPTVSAVGHAWVEQHDGDRWEIADAALQPDGPARPYGVPGLPPGAKLHLAYLPIVVMKNESVSYSRALMDEVGIESVVGIELDAVTVHQ
jgi:Transglutaminase-like superfamily